VKNEKDELQNVGSTNFNADIYRLVATPKSSNWQNCLESNSDVAFLILD
jgi:hypothetical protein